MEISMKLLAFIFVAVMASGCASITGSSNQSVSVQTRDGTGKEVPGANCELTNSKGTWFVLTPGSVSIHRSNDDMQVTCRKDGLEPGRAAIVSDTKGSMFGNIIFGGGIGAVVDHNSGAAYEYPTLIQVVMGAFSEIEAPKPNPDPQVSPATSAAQSTLQPVSQSRPETPSKEERLRELKRLFDAGLITNDAYVDQQKKVLESPK